MAREPLSQDAIQGRLAEVPGWVAGGDRITRTFRFDDFVQAFGFMASSALVAERLGHHPEWRNVYGTVEVALSTHDAGGVTDLDFELAKAMNDIAG